MHYQAVVGVIDNLDLDPRFWAQMVNLWVADSGIEAGFCAYSGRPSLEVIAVVALPSRVRVALKAVLPRISVKSFKNLWTF